VKVFLNLNLGGPKKVELENIRKNELFFPWIQNLKEVTGLLVSGLVSANFQSCLIGSSYSDALLHTILGELNEVVIIILAYTESKHPLFAG